MKTTLLAFAAVAALAAAAPAFAADLPESKSQQTYEATDNGGFKASDKTQSTDAAGTTSVRESTKKVSVDKHGNKTTTVKIKDSQDPKGLFNKSTTKIENKAVEQNGKTEYEHTKNVDGTTVEKTDDVHESK